MNVDRPLPPLPRLIFASRWLQLPLYIGLILAQGVYVYHFWVELVHLIGAAVGDTKSITDIFAAVGYKGDASAPRLNETVIMLVVLGLIDVVMVSNLLIMVIVGGYETFVSRMRLEGHPDQPEWLSHVNASARVTELWRGVQPSQRRALRNRRIHGESSPSAAGFHDICTVRRTRSGCGITIVKRPSGVVRPVIPPGEPFGLYG